MTDSALETAVPKAFEEHETHLREGYRLALLGRLKLSTAGGEVTTLPRGKPLAAATYLALHPEGVDRDELASLLWGSKPLSNARQSVRQVLSRLRTDLGAEIFESDDPVRLAPGVITTDLDAFRTAIEQGDVERAEILWRGEPVSGVSIKGEAQWDAWVLSVRSSAKRILAAGVEARALAAAVGPDGSIVARQSDLAATSTKWNACTAGMTRLLVFEGAEGVGKTRLLEEASGSTVTPGAQVVRVHSEETGPWGGAREWVRGLGTLRGASDVRSETAETLATVLRLAEGRDVAEVHSEGQVGDAFLDLISAVALAQPTLFVIDDAQAIDLRSWELISRLARLRPSVPLLVVLAWNSSLSGTEIRQDIEDWVVSGWMELRRLRAFPEDEIDSPIPLSGGRDEDTVREAGRQVFDNSRGEAEVASGFLEVLGEDRSRPPPIDDETPKVAELPSVPLSDTTEEHFRTKINDLEVAAQDVVRVLGGSEFATTQTLAYSTGLESNQLHSIIGELINLGIVEDIGGGVGLVNHAFAELVPERDGPAIRSHSPSIAPLFPTTENEVPMPPSLPGSSPLAEFWATVRIRATTLLVLGAILFIIWFTFLR